MMRGRKRCGSARSQQGHTTERPARWSNARDPIRAGGQKRPRVPMGSCQWRPQVNSPLSSGAHDKARQVRLATGCAQAETENREPSSFLQWAAMVKAGKHPCQTVDRQTFNSVCLAMFSKSRSVLSSVRPWRTHRWAINASMVPTCTPARRQLFRRAAASM